MKSGRQIIQAVVVVLFSSSMAWAQAARTWVSGVGDDTTPCSRAAPCKTFAAALTKTADGGEINALDAGGYGPVTINKSITIDGAGVLAAIVHSGMAGVVINAPTSAIVTLRNLTIDGAGGGTSGVRIASAGSVVLENVAISNQLAAPARGIDIAVSTPVGVSLRHCSIGNTGGAGIASAGSSAGKVKLSVDGSRIDQNSTGISLLGFTTAAVDQSSVSQNGTGVSVDATSSAHIHGSMLGHNTTAVSNGGAVALWGSQVVSNTTAFASNAVSTHDNNAIIGNGSLGTAPVSVGLQ